MEFCVSDVKSNNTDKVVDLTNEIKNLKQEIAHLKAANKKHDNAVVANIIDVPEQQNDDVTIQKYVRLLRSAL